MRKIKSFLNLFAMASLIIFAAATNETHALTISGSAIVSPNYVEVTFCNDNYSFPLNCRVRADGALNTGYFIYSYANLYLMPGQCEYAYVYATYPYYFVNGAGYGNCYLASY